MSQCHCSFFRGKACWRALHLRHRHHHHCQTCFLSCQAPDSSSLNSLIRNRKKRPSHAFCCRCSYHGRVWVPGRRPRNRDGKCFCSFPFFLFILSVTMYAAAAVAGLWSILRFGPLRMSCSFYFTCSDLTVEALFVPVLFHPLLSLRLLASCVRELGQKRTDGQDG